MNHEDISGVIENLKGNIDTSKISPDMVNNLLNMLGNNNDDTSSHKNNNSWEASQDPSQEQEPHESSSSNDSSNNMNIDMETLLKMKSMIDKMNVKDDPRSKLLASLKPYLKESKKDKLDQYVQLMNMSKMLDFLPFFHGDKNGK